jgi:CHASE3 domain sensor protein
MIRKAALQIAALALLAFMAVNAYLAINHLRRIQKSGALSMESSVIQAKIAGVCQDLTDMETGQRGYLLTGDSTYLQPYTEAKSRIGTHFASLRSALANRTDHERSLEAQLESLADSKQAEMERTITLRQQGYRHRAFVLVNTNEGRDYMDGARRLVSSLSSMESSSFAGFENEGNANLRKAFSETILDHSCLLVLTACLFWLIRYHGHGLEQEAAQSKRTLVVRDSELEKLSAALSNPTRSKITVIEENARLLIEKYGGFLPRQGFQYAEQIRDSAAELERLRQDLLGCPDSNVDRKVA